MRDHFSAGKPVTKQTTLQVKCCGVWLFFFFLSASLMNITARLFLPCYNSEMNRDIHCQPSVLGC